MNINRHNYEEFFLLYVDNELTPAQRRLVDAFVAVNPDLQEEFRLINETRFNFDGTLDADFKAGLLKPVDEEAALSEEQLLLYIDGELNAAERLAIEEAAAKNYSTQKELQLLKRTVSLPDAAIVFPDKSVLYKEAQPAKVVYFGALAKRWAAAAAVILLLGSALWITLSTGKTVDGPVVKNPATTTSQENNNSSEKNIIPEKKSIEQPLVQQSTTPPAAVKPNTAQKAIVPVTQQINTTNQTIVKNSNPVNQQQPLPVVQQKEQEAFVATKPEFTVPEKISEQKSNETITSSVQYTASTTARTIIDNDEPAEETDERFLNEDRQRKSGLKSFAKRAKRLLERTTGVASTDSEVRFAVFAVKTQ